MTKIPEGWIEGILSDIVFIQPGFAFKSKDFDVNEGEYVIKIKNIHPPFVEIYENDIVNIDGYDFEKLKKFQIKKGDYLIAMTGETIGKVGKYTSEKVSYLNQRVCKLTDIGKANYQYISYILQQESFQKFIDTHSFGAAQANISTTEIGNFQIVYPENPQEQKAIAGVLSSFDDKIELLRAENQTLEEMGQTLFKEWFGRYKVGDELPDGWKVGELGDVVDNYDSKRIPIASDKRELGEYPYYGATGINGYVKDYIFDGIYTLLGEDGSVMKENGKPFTQYVWGKIRVNNHAHVLQGKNGFSTEMIKIILDSVDITPYVLLEPYN